MSRENSVCPRISECYIVVQSQKAVSAYFTSEQILPFGFAEQSRPSGVHTVSIRVVILGLSVGGQGCRTTGGHATREVPSPPRQSCLDKLSSLPGLKRDLWLMRFPRADKTHTLDQSSATRRWTNVVLMLAHRLRRWPNIKPLVQHLVSAA